MLYTLDNVDIDFKKIDTNNFVIFGKETPVTRLMLRPLYDEYKTQDTSQYIVNDTDFDRVLKYTKNRPFFGKKWFVFINWSSLKNSTKQKVTKFICNKQEHAVIILYMQEYKDIKFMKNNKRFVEDKNLVIIDTWMFTDNLYKSYIYKYLKKEIEPRAMNLLIKLVKLDIFNIDNYIILLNKLDTTWLTLDDIKLNVPDLRTYDINDYLSAILKSNTTNTKSNKGISTKTSSRKRVHIQATQDLIWRYGVKILLEKINDLFNVMICLKRLMYNGDIIYSNVYEDINKLKSKNKLPKYLEKRSFGELNKLSNLILEVPLKQLIYMKVLFLKINRDEMSLLNLTNSLVNRQGWSEDIINYYNDLIVT